MDTLQRLRQIRGELRRAAGLIPLRNRLIWRATVQGHSRRKVADAAGVSPTQVQRIVDQRAAAERESTPEP